MKLGLCFSGGGARGAYQIGACMALQEAGVLDQVAAFSGTSIGAANCSLVASGELDAVKDIWLNISGDTLIKSESIIKRFFREGPKTFSNGIYEIDKLDEILRDNLCIDKLKNNEVYITLSDVGSADGGLSQLFRYTYQHYIKHDRHVVYSPLWEQDRELIYKQIVASCSIPFVFKPIKIDNEQYYDGGLYDNIPVRPLVEAGCDTIIVLNILRLPNSYEKEFSEVKFHTIKHKHSLGMMLNFEAEQSRIRYQYGYDDCKRYLLENKIF